MVDGFVCKLGHGGAVIRLPVELRALAVFSGQKAVGHGGEGHKPHAQFFQRRKQAFVAPGHHGIAVLHSRHRADGVRPAQVIFIGLRNAPVCDFSFADEVGHDARHFFRGHLGVDAVLEVEVDVVGFQPPEGAFHRPADSFRTGIGNQRQRHLAAFKVKTQAKLGGDFYTASMRGQRFAHQALVDMRLLRCSVNFGSVKKRVPKIYGLPQKAHRLALLRGHAVAMGKAHATEAYGGNGQIPSKNPCIHQAFISL